MSNDLARLSLSLMLAIFVSFALFSLMQNMIAGNAEAPNSQIDYHTVDFVRVPTKQQSVEAIKRIKPEKPHQQETPDTMTKEPEPIDLSELSLSVPEFNMPAIEIPLRLEGSALAGGVAIMKGSSQWQPGATPSDLPTSKQLTGKRLAANSEVIPLVRIQPRYPPQAARRKLSGYVIVEFTIRPDGTVTKPKVVAAKPKHVFDAAALRAIKRWKFKPKLVGGKAVAQYASQKFSFQPITNR